MKNLNTHKRLIETSFLRNILCAVLVIIFTLGSASVDAQTNEGPSGTIATQSDATNDAAIAIRIRDIISELGDYQDVTVQVSDGVVTLRGTANSALDITNLNSVVNRIEGIVAVKNQVTETADLGRRLDPAMDRFLARLDQLITLLPLLLIAALAFAAMTLIGRLITRLTWPWNRLAPNTFIADLYRQIVLIAFAVAGLVIALDILNATALLSTILGAAGIVGLAIGFAVRDTVENYIASVLLSIRQPFRPNDAVEINGDQGKVIRLTSRATILLSFDGNHIRIPNSTVYKSRIINFTQNAERRFQFELLIGAHEDLSVARNIAEACVQSLPFVLDHPAAAVWIARIEPQGAAIAVTGWIDQHATSILLAGGEAQRQVKLAFEEADIQLVNAVQRVQLETREGDLSKENLATSRQRADREIVSVNRDNDDALDEIIKAELDEAETENLLTEDAAKE